MPEGDLLPISGTILGEPVGGEGDSLTQSELGRLDGILEELLGPGGVQNLEQFASVLNQMSDVERKELFHTLEGLGIRKLGFMQALFGPPGLGIAPAKSLGNQ